MWIDIEMKLDLHITEIENTYSVDEKETKEKFNECFNPKSLLIQMFILFT